jgi:hypothetical protein
MSYDLAVWEGEPPANDFAAAAEFKRLYARYMGSDDPQPPAPRIAAYVQALLGRYPDIGSEGGHDSPWSTEPLLGEAHGPLVYFPMVWSRCEEVSAWAAQVAHEHELNCYDPQWNQLRTPFRETWQFELTAERSRPFRDPTPAIVRKILVHLSRDNSYAVLTRADGWYLQVGYGQPAGTRAGWYALERQEGSPHRHFRTEVSDIDEVIKAFVGFIDNDPTLISRFTWRPYPQ